MNAGWSHHLKRVVVVLAALAFRDVFKAGASYFGVSDLEELLRDIHKFDAHSLVGLVGPYPLYRRRYVERSPINFAGDTTCPVISFQGLEDTIVPAVQSEVMFKTLRDTVSPRPTWPLRANIMPIFAFSP